MPIKNNYKDSSYLNRFSNRIKYSWNYHIANRWALCSDPNRYVDKGYIVDYQKEICRRSLLPFNEIDVLSQPIANAQFQRNELDTCEALYYGASDALLNYAGLPSISFPSRKLRVQHGYVFEIKDFEKSKLEQRNLVWSKKMVSMYHEFTLNPDIYPIGAPFFYAKSLLTEKQIRSEKMRLGKNLLAFPMHSQINVDTNYDPNKFLNILINERKRFDTVRVCMYWKDILRGNHKVFIDAGFECVCNGHIYDPNFLRRQKALFKLADATISNGVGSHIGYSLFMEKPHWLIDDEYEYVNSLKGGDAKDLSDVTLTDNFLKVKNAFLNNEDFQITHLQRNIVDEFWGLSDMKTPEEMKELMLKEFDF